MSDVPAGLRYTKEHEWLNVEEKTATLGISDHAQESLGDITYVELPDVDAEFEAGDVLGSVESVKAASDIYCPVAAKVTAVNEALADAPEKINEDPYGEGWLVKLELVDPSDADGMLDQEGYVDLLEEGE